MRVHVPLARLGGQTDLRPADPGYGRSGAGVENPQVEAKPKTFGSHPQPRTTVERSGRVGVITQGVPIASPEQAVPDQLAAGPGYGKEAEGARTASILMVAAHGTSKD